MKTILIISLIVLSQSRMMFAGNWKSFETSAETSKLEVLKGLVTGMALDLPALTMSACLEDLEKISSELTSIISTITNPTFASLFKILKQIEMVLRDLPKAIQECMRELKPDVTRLVAALNVIREPRSAEYEENSGLWVNGVEVLPDLLKMQESCKAENWFEAGFRLGNVLNRLALGQ